MMSEEVKLPQFLKIVEDTLFLTPQKSSPITRPKTPPTPLWHTYSEPPRHEDSPGSI